MSVKAISEITSYKITLLGETYDLTPEEFKALQPECREIAEFGMGEKETATFFGDNGEAFMIIDHDLAHGIEKEVPEINSTPIEAAETTDRYEWGDLQKEIDESIAKIYAEEIIIPLDEVVHSKMETTTAIPMDTKILTDRIDKMRPYTSRKDIDPYVAMHEAGRPMEAIKNAMINDDFCPKGSLPYYAAKILKASTRVTKIELESAAETADETIDRLKRENAEGKEKRKQPKMAVK